MKKFLSMVLTLAMAMSLVTFAAPAAGAKDFTDKSSIQYQEAVDVISAIQIMDGYNDASFKPTDTLTRGAASKIICNMILGPTTASALPTNVAPFPDVPAGSTFAGYIAYCAEHNIISGYADGNFRPSDSLSGYAYLKMLLCALGYDQDIEGYKGANWRVNVAKQALGIGLDDDLNGELDGSRIVTREEAALYAFNTLQADLVEYGTKTTVAVNGATVTVGGNTFSSKTDATQSTVFDNIDANTNNNRNIVQFAEEYFNRLAREPKKNADFTGEGDDFGRPSTRWTWKGVEIGTYKVNPAKTYSGDVKVSTIYNDLNLAGTAEAAVVYLNGEPQFDIDIKRSNGDKLHEQGNEAQQRAATGVTYGPNTAAAGVANLDAKVGDGTITEVFHDEDSNKVVISFISVYPGQITSIHGKSATKDAYVVVEQKQAGAAAVAAAGDFNKSGHDEFETDESFAEDDIVWFTYSNAGNCIGEVHKMDAIEGSLTRRVNDKSATIDGTVYSYGKEKAFDMPGADGDMTTSSSYVVYRDSNGYILWVEEAEFAVERYALVERIWVENVAGAVMYRLLANGLPVNGAGGSESARVRLLLSNGTTRLFDLDEMKRYRNAAGNAINDDYDAGMVVRYSENSDGTVRLYPVSTAGGTVKYASSIPNGNAGTVYAGLGNFSIVDHAINNLKRSDGADVRVDSDTIFVIKDPDTTKTYTGYRNAPNVTRNTAGAAAPVAYAFLGTGARPIAKVIFVEVGGDQDVKSTSKDITFLTNPSDPYEIDGDWYVDYNAVIKGVIQTYPVTVKQGAVLDGPKASANADGNAPSVIVGNDYMTGSIILNQTDYDNDDYLTSGAYDSATIRSDVTQGIKRTSKSDEIKLGTHDDEWTAVVASNVNVYYVDGDGVIAQITLGEISNDTEDMVYYTTDDGDITNLFIVDHDDDDFYMTSAWIDGTNTIRYRWNDNSDEDGNLIPDAEDKFRAATKSDASRASDLINALMWNDGVLRAVYNAGTGNINVTTPAGVTNSYSLATAAMI